MPFLNSLQSVLLVPSQTDTGPPAPTYSVSPSTTSLVEGNSLTFTITTTNISDGTILYWTTSGTTSTSDFSDSLNSGSVTINSNSASVVRTLANNPPFEGSETIVFELRTNSVSGTIVATGATVTVTDAAPTYSVSPSATSANEGSSVTWTVTTTNVASGTTLYWSNSGTTTAADFSQAVNSGSFTIDANGSGSFSLTLNNDLTTEGSESIIIQIRTGSVSGTVVATALTVTISDTSTAPVTSNVLLYSWGLNTSGQLGTNDLTQYNSPVLVQHASNLSWSMISAGGGHTMAIRSDGKLFAWGANNRGQLGNGTTTATSTPVQIGNSSWVAVSAGQEFTVAIRLGGSVFTWGSNDDGQLGTGTLTARSSPALLAAGTNNWNLRSFTMISAGAAHVIAYSSSLTDVCTWGAGYWGQLGTGSYGVTYRLLNPTTINFGTAAQVAAGYNFSMIRHTDGRVWVMGEAGAGALGLNNTTDRYVPTQLPGTWTKLAASAQGTFALGIKASKLFSWGNNASGQLGSGTTTSRSSPVQIGADNWTDVHAGTGHVVAIRSDGTLWTWGLNNVGQLGDGSTTNRSTPGQVGSDTWAQIDAGASHTVAVKT